MFSKSEETNVIKANVATERTTCSEHIGFKRRLK